MNPGPAAFLNSGDRLLVTGHSGFVGSALLNVLQDSGLPVFGAELDGRPTDLSDREATLALLQERQPDIVLHAAALTEDASPARQVYLNVTMLMNLLDALPVTCRRLILFSSTGVYAQPHRQGIPGRLDLVTDQAYAVSKLLGERLLKNQGDVQSWVLRLGPLVGANERPSQTRPRTTLLEQIRRSVRTRTPITLHLHPDDRYDYLHLADLARLLTRLPAPAHGFQVLDVAGPAVSVPLLLAECERILPDLGRWVQVQYDRPLPRQAIGPEAIEGLKFSPHWSLREMVGDYMNAGHPELGPQGTAQPT